MPTYLLVKRLIETGKYDKDKLRVNLNILLLAEQLTADEYEELSMMMKGEAGEVGE